jgi:hypothetical protein
MAFDTVGQVGIKAEDLSSASTSPILALGQKVLKSGNEYTFIYNGGNSAIGTGKYCVLQQSSSSFTSGYTVTVTNASLAGWLAGVAQNTISTGYYGFVMTKGVSLISTDSGEVSANVGVDLALGTDGGFVAAGATFSTAPRFGFTLNSFVTGATSKARIFGSCL